MTQAKFNRRTFLAGGALSVTALLAACSGLTGSGIAVRQTGSDGSTAVPAGTDPEDAAIGMREHPRIIANYGGVYQNRTTEIMLARMVSRLLAAADQSNTSFTITILDSSEVNAFALPGGFVYVTRGILALANDMSELAAVLAHEIAHVALRHARARSNRVRTSEIVDRVVTGILGGIIDPAETAERTRQSLAAFNQSQELEADREGIKIAARAGYDPHAAARFLTAMGRFAQFSSGGQAGGDDFLSSHPSTPDRIQRAISEARQYGEPGAGTVDREGYLSAIDGIPFGSSSTRGTIVGQRYINAAQRVTFTAPAGYTLQLSNGAVVAVANDGAALRFDSASVPDNTSLADYLRSGWIAGLDPQSVTTATQNGIEMASGQAQSDVWSFHVAVARVDTTVYRFIFAGRENTAEFAAAARSTTQSFRRTTADEINSLRKVVLRITRAGAGDTAASLAGRMGALTRASDLFYVINNLLQGDPVEAGVQYKIVVVE